MKLLYVAPSILPSRAANAVHVVMQCQALADQPDCDLVLVAQRSVAEEELADALGDAFGTKLERASLQTVFGNSARLSSLRIAVRMLLLGKGLLAFDAILSRNLYASWVLAVVLKRSLLFETHQLESGFRKRMQRSIMSRSWVTTIVISSRLRDALLEHHGIEPSRVEILHDAAPGGMIRLPGAIRVKARRELFPTLEFQQRRLCGYFGHLYPGRGIDIILAMARRASDVDFLIAGGNPDDIARTREECSELENVFVVGHLPHPVARAAMSACDALLMPYQRSVSIGVAGHDTARWMSPMKMFEYMGAGVPIISSRLDVLEEVLEDRRNCLMVPPDDPGAWLAALREILDDDDLADLLGEAAHRDYIEHHTWASRACRILKVAGRRDD